MPRHLKSTKEIRQGNVKEERRHRDFHFTINFLLFSSLYTVAHSTIHHVNTQPVFVCARCY